MDATAQNEGGRSKILLVHVAHRLEMKEAFEQLRVKKPARPFSRPRPSE